MSPWVIFCCGCDLLWLVFIVFFSPLPLLLSTQIHAFRDVALMILDLMHVRCLHEQLNGPTILTHFLALFWQTYLVSDWHTDTDSGQTTDTDGHDGQTICTCGDRTKWRPTCILNVSIVSLYDIVTWHRLDDWYVKTNTWPMHWMQQDNTRHVEV